MTNLQNNASAGRRRRMTAICIAVAVLVVVALAILLWPRSPRVLSAEELYRSSKAVALAEAGSGMDTLIIDAAFTPESRSLRVTQQLVLTNGGPDARDSLVLRAYPNAFQNANTSPAATQEYYDLCYPDGFSAGHLQMESLVVQMAPEDELQAPIRRYTDEAKTVLECTLPAAWQPGQTIVVEAAYTIHLPKAAYRFGENSGFFAIGNAFVTPALWEDGAYRTDAYYPVGDPFISDCMNYHVTITLPEGYACAASGTPVAVNTREGSTRYEYTAYAMRDFALCISQKYTTWEEMEGGTLVCVYAASEASAREALRYARQALTCYEECYGAYPYLSLTLAEVDFPFGGAEYPGFVMISSEALQAGGQALEMTVAHEVAHQWWYATIGSDPINQAWQDEALCEFSLLDYVEAYYGKADREHLRQTRIETAMRITVTHGVTPGSPLSAFDTMAEYVQVVYLRGAAMLCALDTAMGGTLDDFLKAYYDRYQFQRASRADWEALLAEISGEDYGPLITDYLDTLIIN